MFDRWSWGKNASSRLVSRSVPPLTLSEADYIAACIGGIPPAAIVHSVQLDTQMPVAVDWQLDLTSGNPWPPVGSTAPAYSALAWSGSALFVGSQPIAGVFVEWSVNGVSRWQICDAHERGKLVVGAADWVRVSYIQMAGAGDGAANIRVVVRPAEGGERSHARVSIAPFKASQLAPATVLCYLGSLVDEVMVDQGLGSAAVATRAGFAFLTAGLVPLTSHVDLVSNLTTGVSYSGTPKNVLWKGKLPPSTAYIQASCFTVGVDVCTSVIGFIR